MFRIIIDVKELQRVVYERLKTSGKSMITTPIEVDVTSVLTRYLTKYFALPTAYDPKQLSTRDSCVIKDSDLDAIFQHMEIHRVIQESNRFVNVVQHKDYIVIEG